MLALWQKRKEATQLWVLRVKLGGATSHGGGGALVVKEEEGGQVWCVVAVVERELGQAWDCKACSAVAM